MSQQPLVSIALATYNGALFLRQFLDSVLQQSWSSIEIVACDDGSTDETIEILREYQERLSIRIFLNPTQLGCSQNFSKAISLCQGAWIALADQDDIWEKDKLELLIEGIQSHDAICSDASLIDSNNHVLHASLFQHTKVNFPTEFRTACLEHFATGCTMLLTREFAQTIVPIPPSVPYHDYWIALLAQRKHGIRVLHRPLVRYRQHGNNVLGAKGRESVFSLFPKFPSLCAKWEHSWKHVHLNHFQALRESAFLQNAGNDLRLLDILIDFGSQYSHQKLNLRALWRFWFLTKLPLRQRARETVRLFLVLMGKRLKFS